MHGTDSKILLVSGIILGIYVPISYYVQGFNNLLPALWILSILLIGIYFFKKKPKEKSKILDAHDIYTLVALFLIFAPFYLHNLDDNPFQINYDEIIYVIRARHSVNNLYFDVFRTSGYAYFPYLLFIASGWISQLLFGEITLQIMRGFTAMIALLAILASYIFFRVFSSKKIAFGAAVIYGSNHAFIASNRMAQSNIHLLMEFLALGFFYLGFKQKNNFYIFLGSLFAGIGFYGFFAGRFIFLFWVIYLALLFIFLKESQKLSYAKNAFAISLVVFLVIVAPTWVHSTFIYSKAKYGLTNYVQGQSLLFEKGRLIQKEAVQASSISEGVMTNIISGINIFTSNTPDRSGFYFNKSHGLFDKLTGILVIFGLLLLLAKKDKKEHDFLVLGAFLFLWILFIFIINKTPIYHRTFIMLPFAAYLASYCIYTASNFVSSRLNFKPAFLGLFLILILSIFLLNIKFYFEWVNDDYTNSDSIGATGRYVQFKSGNENYNFILVADNSSRYFSWNYDNDTFSIWIDFFIDKSRNDFNPTKSEKLRIINPDSLKNISIAPPSAVLMNNNLWKEVKRDFTNQFPNSDEHFLTADKRLVAIEIT